MAHSNQIREFVPDRPGDRAASTSTSAPPACSPARRGWPRRPRSRPTPLARRQEVERRRRELDRKRRLLEARIAALRAEFESESEEIQLSLEQAGAREARLLHDRDDMARIRRVTGLENAPPNGGTQEEGR